MKHLSKIESLGGISKFLLKRRGDPEKGGGCRNGWLPLYYFTGQLHLLSLCLSVCLSVSFFSTFLR